MTDTRTLNTQRHDEKIARIRSNPDLSEHAKRRMIGETHREAVAEHARLTQEVREEAVRSAERKMLGISYPERASAHEKALIALSYRDARDPCRARSRRYRQPRRACGDHGARRPRGTPNSRRPPTTSPPCGARGR